MSSRWITIIVAAVAALSLALSPEPQRVRADDTEKAPEGVVALVQLLGQVDDAAFQLDLLKGVNEGLKGRRRVKMPDGWPVVYAKLSKSGNMQVRQQARALSLVFDDPAALAAMRKTLLDASTATEERLKALEALVEKKPDDLAPALHGLLSDESVRGPVLRALAAFDDPKTAQVILGIYPKLELNERRDALNTLASRLGYARALLAAVKARQIAATDVSAEVVRQLRSFNDAAFVKAVDATWGMRRRTPQQTQQRIDQIKAMLTSRSIGRPDLSRGRALFAKTCMQCHTLFAVGGKVGPDLTGSNRANLDYFLLNAVDPNAQIGAGYQATQIVSTDGQNVLGIVVAETDQAVTLRTANNDIIIPKDEIVDRRVLQVSMMPEGLLDRFKPDELRDLAGYLASPQQVDLPPGFKLTTQPTATPAQTSPDPFK